MLKIGDTDKQNREEETNYQRNNERKIPRIEGWECSW